MAACEAMGFETSPKDTTQKNLVALCMYFVSAVAISQAEVTDEAGLQNALGAYGKVGQHETQDLAEILRPYITQGPRKLQPVGPDDEASVTLSHTFAV